MGTAEDEKTTLQRILEPSEGAGAPGADGGRPVMSPQQLMQSCQGLVRTLAWKIHQKLPKRVELDDLISYGQVGLAQAAKDFDPARATQFTTYAFLRIRGAIFDGLAKMSWFSRREYHASRYEQRAHEYLAEEAEEGDEPAVKGDEAQWLGEVTGALSVVQLATMQGETGGGQDNLADDAPSPAVEAIAAETKVRLGRLIDALPVEAARLIRLAYFEGKTLQAAADELGMSKAWASRLHARALRRLGQRLGRADAHA